MKFHNFFYFCGSFLPSWIRNRIPNTDPDPLTWLNPDPIRIRIRNPACPCRVVPVSHATFWLEGVEVELLPGVAAVLNETQGAPPVPLPPTAHTRRQIHFFKTKRRRDDNFFITFTKTKNPPRHIFNENVKWWKQTTGTSSLPFFVKRSRFSFSKKGWQTSESRLKGVSNQVNIFFKAYIFNYIGIYNISTFCKWF
jgi:hypothetical protein